MTALAIHRSGFWLPRFEPWRLLKPLRMDGQFQPYQPIQFEGGQQGMVPGYGASSPPPTTLTFVDWADTGFGANGLTIPATAQAGDLAVYVDHGINSGGADDRGNFSQWTSVSNITNGSTIRSRAAFRVLTADNPGSGIQTNGGDFGEAIMAVFRPDNPINSVSFGTWNGQLSTGNPSSQTVTVSSLTKPLVVIGFCSCPSSTANFSTASPAFDATRVPTTSDSRMGYKIYNSSPSNHSIDMNDLGANNALVSGYLMVE